MSPQMRSRFRSNLRLLFVLTLTAVVLVPAVIIKTIRTVSAFDDVHAPDAQADFVRVIPLTANDVVYSPTTKMLYASVPSTVGAGGNSIKTIDPTTGAITSSVLIGSEPNRLAIASDGTTLYAGLDGAYSVRKFDVSTQTPGSQFALGSDSFSGLNRATDLAVAPGNPDLLVVARRGSGSSSGNIAAYDNGTQRPTVAPGSFGGSDFLSFSASATKLYDSISFNGLNTLKVDANGVSVTGNSSLGQGTRIKFDNGVIYAGNGQVIDPDTSNGTLKGTFSVTGSSISTTAFVPDSSVGRAYYLMNDFSNNSVKTIRVFDINTFVLIGTITVTGVNGDINNMIRWGSNGLAFRTSGGQLIIVQSSLIPSADPIPTPTAATSPTPTPTPTPPATFVRQVPLATNDLIYNAGKQSLYASVPSSAGVGGNSITPVDPVTATVGSAVFIGSEPNKLAVSDDQHTMYVGLDGAGAVRRFDLTTQTPGLQFALGFDQSNGLRRASALAVMPGAPGTIAVSRSNASTAIYDGDVQRPQTQNNNGSLAFRSASTLYVANGSISRMNVSASGLSLINTVLTNSSGNILYDNGLVYMSGGAVVDAENGLIKGVFTNTGSNGAMFLDAAAGRIFFLSDSGGNTTLRAFDINTFLPLGAVTISGLNGTPTSLVRWGSNGLAFRTSTQIFLVQSALVNPGDAVPAATPTPSPVPSPSPAYIPTFTRKLDLSANDLIFNQSTQRIYASVAGYQLTTGNSITTIDPQTATIGPSVFIGSEPNKLALSDDGKTLYANLDGAAAIRRFDISTQTAGLQFTHSLSTGPSDMDVMPGNPQTIALALGSSFGNAVSIYDNGVKRANNVSGNYSGIGGLEFNGPSTIYGVDSSSSNGSLVKFAVIAGGVSPTTITNGVFSGFSGGLKLANGLLYSSGGRIVEPETPKVIATLQGSGINGNFAVDTALGRAFFISNNGGGVTLTAYDLATFVPIGSMVVLPNVSGTPTGLIRWGTNGLAFRVTPSSVTPGVNNPASVYLVQSALVSSNDSIPTSVQFASATANVNEGTATITVTVNRTGDVSATTTVDFATSDGTATAGSDYTATTGTVTFAPGQLSKTFTVPIINDTVFEGGTNETFNVTLSNPTSGVILSSPSTLVITIQDNEGIPSLQFQGTLRITEGNAGTQIFTIPVTLSNASVQTVSIDYATADGTANAGSDYVATSGTLTFPPGTTSGQINVTVNGDTTVEPDETFQLKLSNPVNLNSFFSPLATIANDDSSIQFAPANYSVAENAKSVVVTATRLGATSAAAEVTYSTSDGAGLQSCGTVNGKASSRCDYVPAFGVLTFAAGQISKTITIPIVDDGFVEGDETFNVALSNPTVGNLGANATATITITDDDASPGVNPIDTGSFFVRQNYLDFLSREPDQSGFDFWTNQLAGCGNDASCVQLARVNVSAAFFLSIEFQQTGYLVERMYKVAYGDALGTSTVGGSHQLAVPIVRFNEFLQDTQRIGRDVVVLQAGWEQVLENNKKAFALEFVETARFTGAFPNTMTPDAFVDKLNQNAGNVLSLPERQALINLFAGTVDSSNVSARAKALRRTADDDILYSAEFTRAFVLSQYFGYLRRNPNDLPDTDYTGYDFWLRKLNQFNGNYINAEMVKAFLSSIEYRQRFGP